MSTHRITTKKRKVSFWDLLWSNFWKTSNALWGFIGAALAVFAWIYKPEEPITITLKWVVPSLFFLWVVMLSLYNSAKEAYDMDLAILPNVTTAHKALPPYEAARVLLLLEPCELFSYGVGVAVYHVDGDEFEQLIGVGTVINVQNNGMIQVAVDTALEGHGYVFERLNSNDATMLRSLRVKPFLPRNVINLPPGFSNE